MISSTSPVRPVAPAAGYIGGKRNLAKRLTAIIDRLDMPGYAEPCVGMGGIFLRRSRRARFEFINDISGDVSNFFRQIQEHHDYVLEQLRFRLAGREEFERLRAIPGERLTEIQRAARFLYLQRLAFGGKVDGRHFGVAAGQSARFSPRRIRAIVEAIAERLDGVVIERMAYGTFIERYDRPDMLFYIDPPYWGSETDYGQNVFAPADFTAMAEQLGRIRGRFLLSINDAPQIREIFGAFNQVPIETTYSLATKTVGAMRAGELIISNAPIAAND